MAGGRGGPVEIDGRLGEGGGQVLRTALSLACVTGRPVRVFNIRAGRERPGLKPQHILSAEAASAITEGRLSGAFRDSMELFFEPGPLRPGSYIFDVASARASAGSALLVFQAIAPPLFFAKDISRIKIRGGTHVEWSPPADYINEVFLPAISTMGLRAGFECVRNGYYPEGGGEIGSTIYPAVEAKGLRVTERGALTGLKVRSVVSNLPVSIALRQLEAANKPLHGAGLSPEGDASEAPSPGKGSYVFILAGFKGHCKAPDDGVRIRAGFSALGARGKRAEEVGAEAAAKFLEYFSRKGALDPHLADQVVLFMALSKGVSSFTTTAVTEHLRTNIRVIESFLPVRFRVEGGPGGEGFVEVEGTGI